jgi:DNA-binding CsgD family transcriptional regulator
MLAARCAGAPPPPVRAVRDPSALTAREEEILGLLAAGQSNSEIADNLSLSVRTVERHITNLYGKIDARSRADAVGYAYRRGHA